MWRYFIRGFTNLNNLLCDLHFYKINVRGISLWFSNTREGGWNREWREGGRERGRGILINERLLRNVVDVFKNEIDEYLTRMCCT